MSAGVTEGPGRRPAYLRAGASPRMLVLLVAMLLLAAAFARLGVWQLERSQVRGPARDAVSEPVEPAPLSDVLAPQSPLPGDLAGAPVTVSGTFDVTGELLVPGRVLDGRTGYLVLTPLRVDASGNGSAAPALPVVRGWVADEEAAAQLDPAPPGPVEVVGHLQAGEAGADADLPPGQVGAVSPADLVNRWGGPIYSAYLVLQEVEPGQDPSIGVLPPPTVDGGGLNLQSLGYALQWWIFAGFALLLWARMVRDEARDALAQADAVPHDAVSPDPTAAKGAGGAP